MVQFIETPRTPSLGELLGMGVGQGLQQGLHAQAEQNLKEQQFNRLSKALGMGQTTQATSAQTNQPVLSQENENIKRLATDPKALLAIDALDPTGKLSSHIQTQYSNLLRQEKMEKAEQRADKNLAFSETKTLRNGIDKAYSGYRDTNAILDKMEDLEKTGKLTSAVTAKLADQLGIPLSILTKPESEEYQKLSQNLMRGVTQYGNRVLQVEFENFLKQIPTLLNSPKGRMAIIKNMKLLAAPAKLEYEAKRQIMKENKGVPPLDLYDQIQERVGPEFERLVDESREEMSPAETKNSKQIKKKKTEPSVGQQFKNRKTGKIIEWTGTKWRNI